MKTIDDALRDYVVELTLNQSSPAHIKTIQYRIGLFVREYPGRDIHTITELDLATHFVALRQTRADGTMAGITASHRAFWKFCQKQGWTKANPATRLKSYSYLPNVRTAAPEQSIKTVLAALPAFVAHRSRNPRDIRDAAYTSLAIDSGARRGAMLQIRRADAQSALAAPVSVRGSHVYQIWVKRAKTGAAKVLFTQATASYLMDWIAIVPAGEYLFCNVETGQPLHPDVAGKIIPRICAYTNIAPFRTHAIRKRNVTRLAASDPEIAQRYAGHRDLSTTLAFYKEKREEDVAEAVLGLADARIDSIHDTIQQLFSRRPG